MYGCMLKTAAELSLSAPTSSRPNARGSEGTKERTFLVSVALGTVERGNLEGHSVQLEALNETRVAMSSSAVLVARGESTVSKHWTISQSHI